MHPDPKTSSPILTIDSVSVTYTQRSGFKKQSVHAVQNISLQVEAGQCLGLIGESGCGKSSLANAIMGLVPYAGSIHVNNAPIHYRSDNIPLNQARNVQMVFQDPYASLNPRLNVLEILGNPLRLHQIETEQVQIEKRVSEMLERVGLPASSMTKKPHAFSGGQRQRLAIARALMLNPKVLICDEPVSALDVSIRAQIINLLLDLKKEFQMAVLIISHDLSVIEHMSDQVAVMYLGKVVEQGDWNTVFAEPQHPYTQALFASTLDPFQPIDLSTAMLKGEPASPLNIPEGCAYHPRCHAAQEARCSQVVPSLVGTRAHATSCWLTAQ